MDYTSDQGKTDSAQVAEFFQDYMKEFEKERFHKQARSCVYHFK